jgi:hypothetical protein
MTTNDTTSMIAIEVSSERQKSPSYASRTSCVTITIAPISQASRIRIKVLR